MTRGDLFALVLILLFVGAPVMYLAFRIVAREAGGEIVAWRPQTGMVILLLSAGIFVLGAFAGVRGVLPLGIVALVAVLIWLVAQRRRLTAMVLLDLGRVESKLFLLIGLPFGVAGIGFLIGAFDAGGTDHTLLMTGLFHVAIAVYWLYAWSCRVLVTEEGIARFTGTVAWAKIRGYEWVGKKETVLKVEIEQKRLLRGTKTVSQHLAIDAGDKAALDRLLHQYVPPPAGQDRGGTG